VRARFGAPREVTLEANPTDCTDDNLSAWRAAGIDRLSIGMQSTDPQELVVLGRDHRFGDGAQALDRVLAHGGFAVSCDFILGTPVAGRSPRDVASWLPAIAARPIDHLSIYELTIEPRTAFGKRAQDGRLVPHDDDALADLYTHAHELARAAGFDHYEISSYARPGKRAIHNSLYWIGAPYLGLGVGAASLAIAADGRGIRATNPRRATDYLRDPGAPAERIELSAGEMARDRAWLGMRTSDGVDAAALPPQVADELCASGLAERRGERICPTLRGFLLADRVAARIVQAM